jgi:hypothetical protein
MRMRTMMLGWLRRDGRRTPPPPVTLPEAPGPDPAAVARLLRQDRAWAADELAAGHAARDIAYVLLGTCDYAATYLEGREADQADVMATARHVPVRRPAPGEAQPW